MEARCQMNYGAGTKARAEDSEQGEQKANNEGYIVCQDGGQEGATDRGHGRIGVDIEARTEDSGEGKQEARNWS